MHDKSVLLMLSKSDNKIEGATFSLFKASLKIGHSHANYTYKVHNPIGIRLLTCLCLGLNHLNEHKIRHNFADCMNPLCSCSHFFPHCHNLNIGRKSVYKIKPFFNYINEESLLVAVLFGSNVCKRSECANCKFVN